MSKSKRTAQQRSAELRALLGCGAEQRTVDAVRRLIAERDKLRREVADLGLALAAVWAQNEGASEREEVLGAESEDFQREYDAEIRHEELVARFDADVQYEPRSAF